METSSILVAVRIDRSFLSKNGVDSLFTTGKPEYLTKYEVEGDIYLGKKVETPLSLEQLEGMGQHVLSLVSKIYPGETFNTDALVIFPDTGAYERNS